MKKVFLLLLIMAITLGLHAQPYMITATNYAAGFFGVIADENGQPLEVGSLVHLIWDAAGDGIDPPSLQSGSLGLPTDDDVLLGTCLVGVTGGAPSAGNFILPATAPAADGWCYLRAFHAATPALGTYYSESVSQYAIPAMDLPIINGVQFPSTMTSILGVTPAITVDLTPDSPPIIIAPEGGTFQYLLEIHNNTTETVLYDLWADVLLPDGSVYGPIFTRLDLNMPGEAVWSRQMTQMVPAGAPQGIYTYTVHAGNYNTAEIIHQDSFPFEKEGVAEGSAWSDNPSGWLTTGWETADFSAVAIPDVYFLSPIYPNPFNPTAQIRFGLPEAAHVRIDIYNILGSRVTTLFDRHLNAGFHQIVWEATNVASGLYLVQMKAGGFVHTEKALLLK